MEQFKNMSHSSLINMLAEYTIIYTQMLSSNIKTDEFYKCKQTIEQLTAEVKLRSKVNSGRNSTITNHAHLNNK